MLHVVTLNQTWTSDRMHYDSPWYDSIGNTKNIQEARTGGRGKRLDRDCSSKLQKQEGRGGGGGLHFTYFCPCILWWTAVSSLLISCNEIKNTQKVKHNTFWLARTRQSANSWGDPLLQATNKIKTNNLAAAGRFLQEECVFCLAFCAFLLFFFLLEYQQSILFQIFFSSCNQIDNCHLAGTFSIVYNASIFTVANMNH